jgi:uncharacterized membrane protein required for colicin V production
MTLDLIFFSFVGIFALIGYFSGFWMQLMRLGALVGAYLLAGVIGKPLGPALGRAIGIPSLLGQILASGLAFFLLYTIFSTVGWSILRRRRRKREQKEESFSSRREWDRILGVVLGGAKTFLVLFVMLCALVLVEKPLVKALKKSPKWLADSSIADLARNHNILSGLHLPAVGNVMALGKVSSDPGFREKVMQDPKVRQLLEHPKIKALADDRALVEASRRNDIAAVLANPRLNAVLDDPEIQKLLSEIDLSGI